MSNKVVGDSIFRLKYHAAKGICKCDVPVVSLLDISEINVKEGR